MYTSSSHSQTHPTIYLLCGFLCLKNSLFSPEKQDIQCAERDEAGVGGWRGKGEWQEIGTEKDGKWPTPKTAGERDNDKAGRSSRCLAGLKKPDVDKEELNRSASCIHVANENYKGWQRFFLLFFPLCAARSTSQMFPKRLRRVSPLQPGVGAGVPVRSREPGGGRQQPGGALGSSETQKPAGPVACVERVASGRRRGRRQSIATGGYGSTRVPWCSS